MQYKEFHLVSLGPLNTRTLVRRSSLAYPSCESLLTLFFLAFSRIYNRVAALKGVLTHRLLSYGPQLFGHLWRPFLMGKKRFHSIQQPLQIPYSKYQILLTHGARKNALADNNSYFSPIKFFFAFPPLSLDCIQCIIPQHYESSSDNIMDQMTSAT